MNPRGAALLSSLLRRVGEGFSPRRCNRPPPKGLQGPPGGTPPQEASLLADRRNSILRQQRGRMELVPSGDAIARLEKGL